ncbi:putative toxin [Haloechinothrix sp. LS1_15]|uniref:putative toxin n=1 Tax=Haloechinothrix sp. LS1_15 TaxID=2652248 RepID=UPI00294827FD|nr:hypothetical protein [Haloechinothrix sp. LS1_15]
MRHQTWGDSAGAREHYNIGEKEAITVNNRDRIPDGITSKGVHEVKNVKYLSNTRQIRDYKQFADSTGRKLHLDTRTDTRLAEPLRKAVRDGKIKWRPIP